MKVFFAVFVFGLVIFLQNDICAKAACKLLVKLTPGVNFITILQAAFAPLFLHQKITKPNCYYRKAVQNTFLQKRRP